MKKRRTIKKYLNTLEKSKRISGVYARHMYSVLMNHTCVDFWDKYNFIPKFNPNSHYVFNYIMTMDQDENDNFIPDYNWFVIHRVKPMY